MQFPQIDPVFLSIGPLQFRWYGLMYVLAFVATYFILRSETRRKQLPLTSDDVADLVFFGAMGVVLGGRLGYILFYNLGFYLTHPLRIFAVWEGGMSFHGGFLGVICAFVIYARRKQIPFFTLIDMAALCAPVGLGLGRLGNFINGELYGRQTDMPWGIIFPGGGDVPRHPSQLYEAFLEGLVLFVLVRIASRRSSATGAAGWTFVAGYGLFRFIVEFFRQPDAQIGTFLGGIISMGQLLSLPMFLLGSYMTFKLLRSPQGKL
ncbi:MAG: prolipoprotein diacylglyceryl transferase [Verrucomicrobia bacterium]|nr:prolipoprotein diacylglyceryl transferase [Deltaproteobacteria bacterium]